jgi:hypothetical protein
VPAESIEENIRVEPVAQSLRIQPTQTQPKQNVYVAPDKKTPAVVNHIKPQGVAEGSQQVDSLVTDALKIMRGSDVSDAVAALKTVLGNREFNGRRGHYNFYVRQLMDMYGQQGMTEGKADYNFDIEDLKRLERIRDLPTLKAQALALIAKPSAKPMKPEKVEWFKNAMERMNSPLKVIKLMYDLLLSGEGNAVVGTKSSMNPNSYRQRFGEQGIVEDYNAEYDDEAGMADNNLETLERAVDGIDELINAGDNLPEWCQEKIAVSKSMLVAVWDYMQSEKGKE